MVMMSKQALVDGSWSSFLGAGAHIQILPSLAQIRRTHLQIFPANAK
jgi:hypothetical protein